MSSTTLKCTVLRTPEECAPFVTGWDALAVSNGSPFTSPAWILAWWRHMRPRHAVMRVAVVRDGDRVIGVLPMQARRRPLGTWDFSILGTGHRVSPLAEPGREAEVAAVTLPALTNPRPAVLRLDRLDAASPWPEFIRESWPGGRLPRVVRERTVEAPVLDLDAPDFDTWFKERGARFRERMRRTARQLAAAGGVVAPTESLERLPDDIATFLALHRERFAGRASDLNHPGAQAMIEEAGRTLLPLGRFHLWTVRLPDRPIASAVHVSAGGETGAWAIGWDETASKLSPGIMIVLNVVEEAFGRGDRRFDMGGGASAYKDRFASAEAPLAWFALVPRGARGIRGEGLVGVERSRIVAADLVTRHTPRVAAALRRVRHR